jgi:hypothetical protein
MAFHIKKAMGLCTHGFLLMSKQKNARVRVPKEVIIKAKHWHYPVHGRNDNVISTTCQEQLYEVARVPPGSAA